MKMINCVVYVAGPYRAPTERVVVENIRAAEAVALELWKRGVPTICPHLNTALFGGAAPDDVWLAGDLVMLQRCDAIVMVPGWEQSSGAKVERAHAAKNGKLIFDLRHHLIPFPFGGAYEVNCNVINIKCIADQLREKFGEVDF